MKYIVEQNLSSTIVEADDVSVSDGNNLEFVRGGRLVAVFANGQWAGFVLADTPYVGETVYEFEGREVSAKEFAEKTRGYVVASDALMAKAQGVGHYYTEADEPKAD